jgi:hypothetical protein
VFAAGLAAFSGSYLETSAAPASGEQMSEMESTVVDTGDVPATAQRRELGPTEAELLCGCAGAVGS